jgi:hypothetical protein
MFPKVSAKRIDDWMKRRMLCWGNWESLALKEENRARREAFEQQERAEAARVARLDAEVVDLRAKLAGTYSPPAPAARVARPTKTQPGYLYRWFAGDGTLLYVGESISLFNRIASHRASPWHETARTMTVEAHKNKDDARAAELRAIRNENPLWNRAGKLKEAA